MMGPLFLIHAVSMACAVLLLIPIGILSARFGQYFKHWFALHVTFISLGFVAAIVGLVYGIWLSDKRHFETVHQMFGVAIIVAIVIQITLGISVAVLWRPDRPVRALALVHHTCGRIIIGGAFANVVLGIILINGPLWIYIATGAIITAWIVVYLTTWV